jgi:hypothetical protein
VLDHQHAIGRAGAGSVAASYHALVWRWIMWIPLVVIAVLVGYLFAVVLIPRAAAEPAGPTPALIVTQTIPAQEP